MGPARPTLVPSTVFGSILLHVPVSARHLWVGRNPPRGRGDCPPHRRQGCSRQPASRSSCCSPCSSPAPTVPPAHTACAWLHAAQGGGDELQISCGPRRESPPGTLGASRAGAAVLAWPVLAAALWGGMLHRALPRMVSRSWRTGAEKLLPFRQGLCPLRPNLRGPWVKPLGSSSLSLLRSFCKGGL